VKGLLASAGWAVLGGAALPLFLPAMPAFRTFVAAAAVFLFVLALAAPRAAFAAALLATTGLGVSALLFGLPNPAAALPSVLAGFLAGAALRDLYEIDPPAPPPVLTVFRALAAGSALSALAAIAAARSGYLLVRFVPPPRAVNVLGEDASGAILASLTALSALVLAAGFHRVASHMARDAHGRRAVDAALVAAALLPGLVALAQKLGVLPVWRADRWEEWHRVQATFTDPSAAGVAVVLLLPTLLACSGRGAPLLRGAAAVGAVLLVPLLVDSGSRAGFVGALLACGLFLVFTLARLAAGARPGPRRKLAIAICAVAFFAFTALLLSLSSHPGRAGRSTLVSRLARTFQPRTTPSEGETERLILYEAGLALFRDHPVAGVGLGAFRTRFPDTARSLGRDVRWTDNPPSLYLGTLVESGISGGFLLALLLAALLRGVVAALDFRERSSEDALRSASSAASIVGLLLIFLFGSHLVYPEIAVLFGILAARLPFPRDGRTGRLLVALVPVALAGASVLLIGGVAARLWESRGPDAAFAYGATAGIHPQESEPDGRLFRWTAPEFALLCGEPGRAGVLRLPVRNGRPDRRPVTLQVFWDDVPRGRVTLSSGGWRALELRVPGRGVLRASVTPDFIPLPDSRRLGIAVGTPAFAP
jgi:O-antigen ligase